MWFLYIYYGVLVLGRSCEGMKEWRERMKGRKEEGKWWLMCSGGWRAMVVWSYIQACVKWTTVSWCEITFSWCGRILYLLMMEIHAHNFSYVNFCGAIALLLIAYLHGHWYATSEWSFVFFAPSLATVIYSLHFKYISSFDSLNKI